MNPKQEIAIYTTDNKQIELEVQLDEDTVWLDRSGIARLFDVKVPAISKHISNIYNDKELIRKRTVSKMEIVRKEGSRDVKRNVEFFNLDMIISVGYRVNSKRATQFRIWATRILRTYLVDGYVINQKRLEEESRKFQSLESYIKTLRKVVEKEKLTLDQSKELVKIVSDYSSELDLLEGVDKGSVSLPRELTQKKAVSIEYDDALKEVTQLKDELKAGNLFGNERCRGLESSLKAVLQTYDKKELYASIEEKAANLLYLVIKNHPFTDGNKRIGTFLFLRFLDVNGLLYHQNGEKTIDGSALVAIALMIAQSDGEDKDMMVNLVVNLIMNSRSVKQ